MLATLRKYMVSCLGGGGGGHLPLPWKFATVCLTVLAISTLAIKKPRNWAILSLAILLNSLQDHGKFYNSKHILTNS